MLWSTLGEIAFNEKLIMVVRSVTATQPNERLITEPPYFTMFLCPTVCSSPSSPAILPRNLMKDY